MHLWSGHNAFPWGCQHILICIWFIPQFDYDYNICVFLLWQNQISCCFLSNLVDVADGEAMEHLCSPLSWKSLIWWPYWKRFSSLTM